MINYFYPNSISSNMALGNESNEELKKELAEVTSLIEDNEGRENELFNSVKERFGELSKRTRATRILLTNCFIYMSPKNFTNFLPILLLVLHKLIDKLSESTINYYKIFAFLAVEEAPINFGLWFENINSMFNSDKSIYLSYYLLFLDDNKAYKLFTIGMPKPCIAKMLSDPVKDRIIKLINNKSIHEIYSIICQMPYSKILLVIDMAFSNTFVTKGIRGKIIGFTLIFLCIYIKSQNSGNSTVNAATTVAIFFHEFMHFLRRIYSTSIQSNIRDTTPISEIYKLRNTLLQSKRARLWKGRIR